MAATGTTGPNESVAPLPETDTDTDTEAFVGYPLFSDEAFNEKIARKQEFQETRFQGVVAPIEARAKELEQQPFELASQQLFVKTFMSFQTPYNSMLLYHGLGTGKTCSAIGIAEEMRHYLNKFQIDKSILVVASPNVQQNFRKELFNEEKLIQRNGEWVFAGCVGNALLHEINPTHLLSYPRDKLIQQVESIIDKNYRFLGYIQFANMIESLSSNLETFKETFNGRLVIIDEFHNMRTALAIHRMRTNPTKTPPTTATSLDDSDGEKQTTKQLDFLVDHADNLRLLLLSATPLYNSYKEIIWTLNLLNRNDKRPLLVETDIFQPSGEFQPNGKEKLIAAARGYVSFVRGDNPYTFPFRVYPTQNENEERLFPTLQLNGKPIEESNQLSILQKTLTAVKIKKCQYEIYEKVLARTFQQLARFSSLDGFRYTDLQLPLQCLNIAYPISEEVMKACRENKHEQEQEENTLAGGRSTGGLDEPELEREEEPEDGDEDGDEEEEPEDGDQDGDEDGDEDEDEDGDEDGDEEEEEESETEEEKVAMSVPEPVTEGEMRLLDSDPNNVYVGTKGLQRVMSYQDTATFKGDFAYNGPYDGFFKIGNIGNYSCKIEAICKKIQQSKGVLLVYSQYLDGGLIPMALALEEMGMRRYGPNGKSLFKEPPAAYRNQSYVMITGDRRISPNNTHEVRVASSMENREGQVVKVVLITMAGAEGLDLKFIRQVHVMDPWYNLNRIEQILGRAVRNFSHKDLPFEERNVEIFLYATWLRKEKANVETVDLYLYRKSEKKAMEMGRITRALKEGAVDCLLNYEQQHYTHRYLLEYAKSQGLDPQGIAFVKQRLSDGTVIERYPVGDMPYSANCDFMETCEYECAGRASSSSSSSSVEYGPVDTSTYDESLVKQNVDALEERIRALFRRSYLYTYEKLYKAITKNRQFDDLKVYYALSRLIDDRTLLHDKYDREGYLVNMGRYYLFQPKELANIHLDMDERTAPIQYTRQKFRVTPNEVKLAAKAESSVGEPQKETEGNESVSSESDPLRQEIQEIYQRILSYYENPTQRVPAQQGHTVSKYMGKAAATLRQVFGVDESEILALAMDAVLDLFLSTQKVELLKGYVKGWPGYQEPLRQKLDKYVHRWIETNGAPAAEEKEGGGEGAVVVWVARYDASQQRVGLVPLLVNRETRSVTPVSEYDQEKELKANLHAYVEAYDREKIQYPLGFVSMEANGGSLFKVADEVGYPGASCFQKKQSDVVRVFQQVLPEEYQPAFEPLYAKSTKDALCVLLLLTLKYFNHRYPNRVWYLPLETHQLLFTPV